MGSERKRKRVTTDTEAATPSPLDKAERKRLKKEKKEVAAENGQVTAAEKPDDVAPLVSPIATPMASRKLTKKVFKLIAHASKEKAIRRGIKEVVLALRKQETGVIVLAGNVFPVEVIAHVPLLCEEANIPYCFVPTKTDLGNASLTKRPTSVVLVSKKRLPDSMKTEMADVCKEVQAIQNLY